MKNIMVCVTQQKTSENLILKGVELQKQCEGAALYVIHVVNEKDNLLYNLSDGEALEYLFKITKDIGADLVVKRSKNVISTLVAFSKDNAISYIVMGSSGGETSKFEKNFKNLLPNVEFII